MRAVIVILDGVGVGKAPDAEKYGDFGASTMQHIAGKLDGIFLRNMWRLGLPNVFPIEGMARNRKPDGAFGSMIEQSVGKDSTSGHWELGGLIVKKPFPLYPDGFPDEVIRPFVKAIGKEVLWNKPASGTEIINRLGDEHIETGCPIVYTSADSVFQIAAHEKIVPVEKLYQWCKNARDILKGEHAVARVIARPFVGSSEKYERTPNRHDFSLPPFDKTMLDLAKDTGYSVVAVGKVFDLYAGKGFTEHFPSDCNKTGINITIEQIKRRFDGILMTNLVDFDMLYGHRRNVVGFYAALKEWDAGLGKMFDLFTEDDILFVTADHGNDPTHPGSDHTREQVPILVYGKKVKPVDIGQRKTFADLAATVCEFLGTKSPANGESFLLNIL